MVNDEGPAHLAVGMAGSQTLNPELQFGRHSEDLDGFTRPAECSTSRNSSQPSTVAPLARVVQHRQLNIAGLARSYWLFTPPSVDGPSAAPEGPSWPPQRADPPNGASKVGPKQMRVQSGLTKPGSSGEPATHHRREHWIAG